MEVEMIDIRFGLTTVELFPVQ